MLAQATKTGPAVAAFCEMVMADRPHPEQGFRTCPGVLALVTTYGPARADAACQRGVTIHARTVTSIRSILKTGPRFNRIGAAPSWNDLKKPPPSRSPTHMFATIS